MAEVQRQVEKLFGKASSEQTAIVASGGNGRSRRWPTGLRAKPARPTCRLEKLERLNREQLERRLETAVEDRYRPEMRRMERALVLQILDTAWKDHLLAMDHLRTSVGLRGYAQVDPKVEYKREGMRTFELMWSSRRRARHRLIFRMEQLDEFVGSTWIESEAIHEEAPDAGRHRRPAAGGHRRHADGPQARADPQSTERVGRNDPCPCGSGKKFKNCCMRKTGPHAA